MSKREFPPSGTARRIADHLLQLSGAWRLQQLARRNIVSLSARVTSPSRLSLGREVTIQRGAILHCGGKSWCGYAGHVRIGDGVVVGPYSVIYGAGGVDIDDFVHLGPGVNIMTQAGQHDANRLSPHPTMRLAPVRIAAGSWIGAGAVILGGVTIGRCATVAPNAVVQIDVPDNAVAAGNPARIVFRHEMPA